MAKTGINIDGEFYEIPSAVINAAVKDGSIKVREWYADGYSLDDESFIEWAYRYVKTHLPPKPIAPPNQDC